MRGFIPVLGSYPNAVFELGCASFRLFLVWFNLFIAELSQKRYWRGPKSQEVVGGSLYLTLHCDNQNNTPALRWAAMRAI